MRRTRAVEMQKAMSWSDTGSSALKLNIRQLCLFGFWPLCESRAYHVYSVFVFILMAWNTVEDVLALYFSFGKLEETTMALTYSITYWVALLKMVLLTRDRQKYFSLAQTVDALMTDQAKSGGKDPELAVVLEEHRRRGARITRGTLMFMGALYLLWYPMPLVVHPEERRLPLAQHDWDNNTHYYGLSYAVQVVTSIWATQNTLGVDCLFATFMILVSAQLKVLTSSIEGLTLQTKHVVEEKGSFSPRKAFPEDYDNMYRDLCHNIRRQQNVLSCIKDLQTVMNPVAMTQIAGSVLLLCVALFQATYSNDMSTVLRCAAFLPFPGGQVYLYCWAAHNISEEAEAMATAAYSSSWVEADQRFKRTLQIVISRARKPLVLTAGQIYPIDLPSFLSMVNASYSFYALLSQMKGR